MALSTFLKVNDGQSVSLREENLSRTQSLLSCCQSLVNKLPLPSIGDVIEKDGLNGLEYMENFNMLRIDLSIYYGSLAKVFIMDKVKSQLARIDSLVSLMIDILQCPEYKNIFVNSLDYNLCKTYLKRLKFYGSAISYIIHRYEIEDIYLIPAKNLVK
jgi:hypothetical protein